MNANSGSTGTISSHLYGQKNVKLEDGTVTQVNGKVQTDLFTNVIDLSSSISGLVDEGIGEFQIAENVWDSWDSIYVGLKQSDEFVIFLLTREILSGTWSTPSGNSGNIETGLSHFIAFGGDIHTPNPVPVPAAVWLFGSGIAGMIGISRKKLKATQR